MMFCPEPLVKRVGIQTSLDQRLRAKHHRIDPRKQTPSDRHQIGRIQTSFQSESVAGFPIGMRGRVGTEVAPRPSQIRTCVSSPVRLLPRFQPVASADFALVERVVVGIGNGKAFIKRLNRSHVMPLCRANTRRHRRPHFHRRSRASSACCSPVRSRRNGRARPRSAVRGSSWSSSESYAKDICSRARVHYRSLCRLAVSAVAWLNRLGEC